MPNVDKIIQELVDREVFVFLDNGVLKTRCDESALDEYVVGLIKDNKQAIMDYLSRVDSKSATSYTQILQRGETLEVLSFSQQRLWFIDQIDSGSAQYNIPTALKLSGDLNREALLQSLTTIVDRHESLRTVFFDSGEGPRQKVQHDPEFDFPLVDLSGLSHQAQSEQIDLRVAEEANSPFDLSCDLMLRAQLLKLSDAEHILLLTMHHIASDGWSVSLLIKEVSQLYPAFVTGEENPLSPLPIQYADYAHWQRDWLQGAVLDQQIDYWKQQLSGLPAVHSLPLDHSRPQNQSFSGGLVSARLGKKALDQLNALCSEQGATLFMGLHAAFSALLSRYSGESDIVVGSPIANREQAEVADLIGFFVNTLVLRSDVSGSPSFIALLQQSKQTALDAYAHQQVPFEQLVEVLQPERSLSHSPLFQVMLVLQNNEQGSLSLPGLTFSPVPQSQIQSKFDVTLNAAELDSGLLLEWEYNTDIFETSTIERMADHFVVLLNQLLARPNDSVFALDLVSETECENLLTDWNTTKANYPQDSCIHELFEAQVAKSPEAIALTFENQQLTYAELNQKANQLAHYLVNEKQVVPDTLVGICLERSLDMVVAILGILKAGGAYVPLDPDYPEARLTYMLQDAGLSTVISHSDVFARTPVSSAQVLCFDDLETQEKIAAQATTSPKISELHSRHLAYVIYTSGSTGNPKGVMVEHQAIVNRIHWMHTHYGAFSHDVFLQKTPFSFDVSVWEFFWPLMAGSQLVIAQPQGHTDPQYLSTLIQAQGVTKLHFVPSMLSAMLVAGTFEACHSVKQVFCSGEALALQHERDFYRVLPESELHNLYGPTEAAVDVSYWACPKTGSGHSSVPIGRPIDNIQLHVLDSHCQLVPQGVVGELHIGGVGLARGYLNRAELTAEKFISNPFSDNLEDRLYKTGDLVRWLPDGNLEYIGRIDHQVKIRGFRIELGEIENTLLSHEAIQESVVIAREDQAGDKRLVAYVVLNESGTDEELKAEQLNEHITTWRSHLSQSLPEYMVPSSFVVLDNIPLTPNGKVDRNALPEPDVSQQQASYVAPSTETEKLLSAIWQDILGLEQVGVTDNFFRLGGHSLLLIQMLSRLQEAGHPTDVRQLFSANSLGELAEQLDQAAGCEDTDEIFVAPENLIPNECDRITPAMLSLIALAQDDIDLIVNAMPGGASNIQDMYPLAPLQEGILFHHQMSDGKADAYVMPVLLSAKTRAQRDDFLKALQGVVNRHDVLRTAVLWEGLPQAVQVVCRDIELPIEHFVLDPDQAAMPQLQAKMAPAQQWMDIRQAPLLRVHLTEDLQSENYYILLQLHHIIDDVTSITMIQSEVQLILAGREDALIEATPYRELVAHALHQAQTSDAETFFREKLGDVSEPTAPFNLLDVHGNGGEIIESSERLTDDLSHDIRHAAQTLGVTPAALFHTAFALVTGICSGRDDVVFGTVLSGRLQGTQGVGHMLGMTINTLPYRLQLREQSVEQSVQQAQNELLALLPYEQSSLALAQQSSGLAHGTPLFSAMLNYRHVVAPNHGVTFDSGIEILSGHERTNYPFTVSIDDLDDGFGITAQVNDQLDPERVVSYIRTAMEQVVTALAQQPEKPLLALDVLPNAEREKLLTDWSGTKADYPQDSCIHELFEAQVAKAPDAIALTFEDQQLTYEELNQKANQLAHYLVTEKQVVPDTLVGICLERSLDMVVAILGILKAGGAYVPLDPDYPEARLTYTIQDASLDTVITHSDVLNRIPAIASQALCLDEVAIQNQITAQPTTNVTHVDLRPSHLAYVIYTSGSTGNPKGVLVNHANVTRLFSASEKDFDFSNQDVWTLFHSYAFDFSVWELWGALIYGGRLVVVPYWVARSSSDFYDVLAKEQVTVLNQTPSAFSSLVSIDASAQQALSLRYVIFGGEKLNPEQVVPWFKQHGDQSPQLVNMYGITETTVHVTYRRLFVADVENQEQKSVIGRPLSDLSAWVLNTENQMVPVGVAGELYVGGAGLTRGYLNRAELTAEKFIGNPFSDNPEDRLYKTGDLVRWLPDGNLEYMGRIDDQVKIRGFRIELGEIENTLLSHEAIQESVVIAREDQAGDKRLMAYVVLNETSASPNLEEFNHYIAVWRAYLCQSLPEYMVPSNFVILDQIPLTSNGKVDRKALPAPDLSKQQQSYVPPVTDTEKRLCAIWEEVLEVEKVGLTDNFFQLGGHSILATKLLVNINDRFDINLKIKDIFSSTNVMDLDGVVVDHMINKRELEIEKDEVLEEEVSW